MSSIKSELIGIGSYLPEFILSNYDLPAHLDTSNEWIVARTGIEQRHIAKDEVTSDLATKAAERALKDAKLNIDDIDAIIVATTTADQIFPAMATKVQYKLGATKHMLAFDVQAVCAGFVNAMLVADNFIKSGSYNNILVIGADKMSKILDWQDRGTCILFGDGAGAVVLSANTKTTSGIIGSLLYSDGSDYDILKTSDQEKNDTAYVTMQGQEVFKRAVTRMGSVLVEILEKYNMTTDNIDLLIPHQANSRIIKAMASRFNIDTEKVVICVNKHANTSAASVPLALDNAYRAGRIKKGDIIVLNALGGGMTWGANLIRF